MNSAVAPSVRSSAASCSPASSRRPATTREAPCVAKAIAVARPMPVSAPVIKTTGLLMVQFLQVWPSRAATASDPELGSAGAAEKDFVGLGPYSAGMGEHGAQASPVFRGR